MTVGATVGRCFVSVGWSTGLCFSRADSIQMTTVTGWDWDACTGRTRRSQCCTVPEFTGSCPHIACVSPGAFRNTSAQTAPSGFPIE